MTHRRPHRAFTLIEVLIASSLVVLLAGSLYASLSIAFKARKTATSAVETQRRINLCMERIRQDLQVAMVPGGSMAGTFTGNSGLDLLGAGSGDLTLYVAAGDAESSPPVGEIKKVEYNCQGSVDSGRMVLTRYVTDNLLATTTPEPREEVICRGLKAFTLRFFDGSAWQESWDSSTQSNALPLAVEVTIELEDSSGDIVPASRVMLLPCGQAIQTGQTAAGASP